MLSAPGRVVSEVVEWFATARAMIRRIPTNAIEGTSQMVVCAVVQAPKIEGRGMAPSVIRPLGGRLGIDGKGRMGVILFGAPEQQRV